MAVHVGASLPIHPLTVGDLEAMVRAGILAEDDRVELLEDQRDLARGRPRTQGRDLRGRRHPEYWVLDLTGRRLIVHRDPVDGGGYATIDVAGDDDTVTAARLPLTVAVAEILPPRAPAG